jgi:hypothetical protein
MVNNHPNAQRKAAASTQNQAFCAIIFFYKEVLAKPLQNVNVFSAALED